MSSIPDFARGWRRGCRVIVTTIHELAERANDNHTICLYHGRALTVGVHGKIAFNELLETKDFSSDRPDLVEAAIRHAVNNWRTPEHHLGYLIGLQFGIDELHRERERFNHDQAKNRVLELAATLEARFAALLRQDHVIPRRGSLPKA